MVAASDGRAAVAELARHPETDLVLMDVMMPDMDGDAATAAIRRMPGYRDVPIIMVTAKAMPGDREKSLEAGADGYLTKPVDTDDLVAHVRRLLAGRAPRAES
ncbi:response regulator [Yinghuangia aomiensis]